ncbi:subtilisin-like protein [Xylaria nigripes]|nr:subtilisin-like protein [Xylaria nigripes]
MKGTPLLLAAVLGSSLASGLSLNDLVIHETRQAPSQYKKVADAKGDVPITLRFALKQSNLHRAAEYINDVSHPKSKNFGKFWTPEQVISAFAPSDEALSDTVQWLRQVGVPSKSIVPSAGRNWIKVNTTVAEAEKLLNTTYGRYQDSDGSVLLGCESYSIPLAIQHHLDFVSPTIQFDGRLGSRNSKRVSKRNTLAPQVKQATVVSDPQGTDNCSEQTTPACLRAMFGLPEEGEVVPGNSFGIVEFAPQSYNQEDLNGFFSVYTGNVPNGTAPIVDRIDGGFLSNGTGSGTRGESNLDLCYAMSLVYPMNVTLLQTGDNKASNPATDNAFLDAIDGSYCTYEGGDDPVWDAIYPHSGTGSGFYNGKPMCGVYNATNVISVSYGLDEANRPVNYNTRECHEYMKLGLMGVSTLYSSGDSGTTGNSGTCLGENNVPHFGVGRFSPLFPATCPWVTTVGGSQLPAGGSVTDRQTVARDFVPGGGFSNQFAMPDYQKEAIASYYALHDPGYNSSVYNNSQIARGFPDVIAPSTNFITGIDGGFFPFTGTSAAAPLFASMIALINGERIKAGKGPIGFLNAIMYEHPEMFDDVTEGQVKGCGSEGFAAVEGWDPASGLGTPNYAKMREVFLSLP